MNTISGYCPHMLYTTSVGPTTDQHNHFCQACGTRWTTFPRTDASDLATLRKRVIAAHTGDNVDGCGMTNDDIARIARQAGAAIAPDTGEGK